MKVIYIEARYKFFTLINEIYKFRELKRSKEVAINFVNLKYSFM